MRSAISHTVRRSSASRISASAPISAARTICPQIFAAIRRRRRCAACWRGRGSLQRRRSASLSATLRSFCDRMEKEKNRERGGQACTAVKNVLYLGKKRGGRRTGRSTNGSSTTVSATIIPAAGGISVRGSSSPSVSSPHRAAASRSL